jgi:ornithine cyclodeaminase/alanine dehydrogenase
LGSLLHLSREEVEGCGLSMADVIDAVEVAFRDKGDGRAIAPPKLGVHFPGSDSFLHAMPAYVPAVGAVGVKWVASFPGNPARGLPAINGLIILSDAETGLPLSVMDASWVTAMRTGAVTAVAARRLARADSRVVAILGCGVQGRSNLLALREVLPVDLVRAFDPTPGTREGYAEEIAAATGVAVEPVASVREAVVDADIVVTAGPLLRTPHRSLQAGWLAEGSFLAMVDYDTSVDPVAVAELDLFCTDDIPQFRSAQERGHFRTIPPIHADLGELVVGAKVGRTSASERTAIAHLGLGICDVAVAARVYERARDAGIGTALNLWSAAT